MINKNKTCCCLLLFSSIWLVPFADADGQRGSDAAARRLKRIIGETAKADVSGGAVSIKQALEEMDVHLAREERETGLPGPSQTTRLTLLAGRTLLAKEPLEEGEDTRFVLDELARSFEADKGTLGANYSSYLLGMIYFRLQEYDTALDWLERSAKGLKKGELHRVTRVAMGDVFRKGKDHVKFSGSVAGKLTGLDGRNFEIRLERPDGHPVFEGYRVEKTEEGYRLSNVRPGSYLLEVTLDPAGEAQKPAPVIVRDVVVHKEGETRLDVPLPPLIRLLSPAHDKEVEWGANRRLAFAWNMPSAPENARYVLMIRPSAGGETSVQATMILEASEKTRHEIAVSRLRSGQEYVWQVLLPEDGEDLRAPTRFRTSSGLRKFLVCQPDAKQEP